MKIGIIKLTTLPNGFEGEFWRMGTTILPYNEALPTDLTREVDVEVQFYLYKDFGSYVANLMSAHTVWVKTTLPYASLNNNAFDNIINKVISIESDYFYGCESVEV